MNIKALILLALLLSVASVLSSCSSEKSSAAEAYLQDQGSVEVYFCPYQDCEGALVSFFDSAETSIHCALFDIGLKSVQEKLLDKKQEIEVLVVTDDSYLKKFDHPFVKADRQGLMHNKFCIIDGKRVSTGSMNPTENGAHKNNNNLLLISSNLVAKNYEEEFQELWQGTFKKGNKTQQPKIKLFEEEKVDAGKEARNKPGNEAGKNARIETYFCPEDRCAEQAKEELKKAERSIYFMTFSFTHEGIANIILLKNLDGIDIRGVMEAKQISKYSEFERLSRNDIKVRKDGNKYNMHHKILIIDEKTVITGSFNPSANGDSRNDENMIIIEDEGLAKRFVEEFQKIYAESS